MTGCSSQGTVSGKITYKGESLGGGRVLFVSEGHGSCSASIGEDGNYTVNNVPVGPVAIAVETKSVRPVEMPPEYMPRQPPPESLPKQGTAPFRRGGTASRKYVEIPEDYADPKKSGLKYQVSGGRQKHDIPLE
jgi:hypothetical protein